MMRPASLLAAAALAGGLLASGPALAQAGCEESQKLLGERADIMKQISGLGKKQIDPGAACSVFTKLASNGAVVMKWMETNKDWCSVPDDFVTKFKADHQKVSAFKGKACQAASQRAVMEKQRRQAQQQAQQAGGGGLLGGPGLTGEYKVPKGAL